MLSLRVLVLPEQAQLARELIAESERSIPVSDGNEPSDDLAEADRAAPQFRPFGSLRVQFSAPMPLFLLGALVGFIVSEFVILDVGATLCFTSVPTARTATSMVGPTHGSSTGASSSIARGPIETSMACRSPGISTATARHAERELVEIFDGDVHGWFRFSGGNFSEAKYDTDHNGVPDETVEHTHGIRASRVFIRIEVPLKRVALRRWSTSRGVCSDP